MANPPSTSLIERWARFAHRRRGLVLAGWLAGLVLVIGGSQAFGGQYSTKFSIPGSEFEKAFDLLQAKFPSQAGDSADVVFEAPAGVTDPQVAAHMQAFFARVAALPDVAGIESPYERPQGYVSPDGTVGRAVIRFSKQARDLTTGEVEEFVALADAANTETVRVEVGGAIVFQHERPEFGSEMYGLAAAIIILLIAFGSVVAMGLPVGAAVFGLGAGFAVIGLAARVADFPEFSPQFAGMIGIGVGIDYSLLVVTRYREGLHSGKSVEDSIVLALTTSGRAVIFAGIVVAIAFLGLYAMGLPFVAAMGTAGAIVVVIAVLVALTLMPALLSIAGTRVDAWKVPFLHSTEGVDPKSGWFRFSQAIQRRPLPYFLGVTVVLLFLGSPVFAMRLGFTDAGNNPDTKHTRRAYDLLVKGFGPGFNAPLLLVAEVPRGARAEFEATYERAKATSGVAQVSPVTFNEAGDTAVFTVIPATSPQDRKTVALVHHLRDEVDPASHGASQVRIYVAGESAALVDSGDRIRERMPFLFAAVIGLSFVLLMVVFRSVLVAAKAAVMNLLSIASAYGVIVAIFQWGWLSGILEIEPGPIEPFLPMMLFAILFGLSMDYEVFLISRIREEYLKTRHNATAVSHGLAATARVITAAAAIMVTVFLAFVLGEERTIKEFGTGLATAIFVDSTLVRLILVPATMELLGEANWWLPGWLDRILPRINLDAPVDTLAEPVGAAAGGS